MALPPSVSCLHFGFGSYVWFPPRHLFGLRLVFPFEYLQRLHDSMIGPALVQRRVLNDPWTYELSRAMPYPEVHLLLQWFWSPFFPSFSGSAPFFFICLGIYFDFIPVPDCFCCLGLGHFFNNCFGLWPYAWLLDLTTRCGGIYSLISMFGVAASSTPFSWSFGMNFVIFHRSECGLHIRLSRVG